jgi:hypothetical protein
MALRDRNRPRPRKSGGVSLQTGLHPRPRDGAVIRELSLQRIDTPPRQEPLEDDDDDYEACATEPARKPN